DIGSGELLCRQTMKDDWNEISPDGKTWIVGGGNTSLRVCSVETGMELFQIKRGSQPVFAPDGNILSIGPDEMCLLHVPSARVLRRFEESRGLCSEDNCSLETCFSRDGKLLAVWNFQQTGQSFIRLWDVATGMELRSAEGHRSAVTSAALTRDGKLTAS